MRITMQDSQVIDAVGNGDFKDVHDFSEDHIQVYVTKKFLLKLERWLSG